MKHYYSADPDCLKPIWVIIAVAYIVIIALSAAFLSSIKIIMIPYYMHSAWTFLCVHISSEIYTKPEILHNRRKNHKGKRILFSQKADYKA